MELKRRQSDLTETAKRALATNRGQSETLKSTYETLESDYKTKRHTLNAEQARFVRLIKTKLPAIKVSHEESEPTLARHSPFSTPPNSPQVERKLAILPSLVESSLHVRRRSRSFSDLSEAAREHKLLVQGFTRQKSFDQHIGTAENKGEQRNVTANRPRSLSNIELLRTAKFNGEEDMFENDKLFLTERIGSPRKLSSPARLSLVDVSRTVETRKLTSKKPLSQQLEDVKDLRYLRTGKYSSETTVTQ